MLDWGLSLRQIFVLQISSIVGASNPSSTQSWSLPVIHATALIWIPLPHVFEQELQSPDK